MSLRRWAILSHDSFPAAQGVAMAPQCPSHPLRILSPPRPGVLEPFEIELNQSSMV